jgi:hypothetical protein
MRAKRRFPDEDAAPAMALLIELLIELLAERRGRRQSSNNADIGRGFD